MNVLEWKIVPQGVCFSVRRRDGVRVAVERWALEPVATPRASPASIAPLLRLLDSDDAELQRLDELLVSHAVVATFSGVEAGLLALPPRRDPAVAIRSRGNVTEASFALECELSFPGAKAAVIERTGSMVTVDGVSFLLSSPLFRLLEAVDEFNASTPADAEERMRAWGAIRALATDEVQYDNYLGDLRVIVAHRFSLRPFVNARGEPDFDVTFIDPLSEQPVLAESRQDSFGKGFRRFPSVRNRYPAGNGTHVVLEPRVQNALVAAHRAMRGTPSERREFIRSPHAHIRAVLPDALGEFDLSEIFHDADLSERVVAVGIYEPRVLPWLVRKGHSWLPPEGGGIRIGETSLELSPESASKLLTEVREARAEGRPAVTFGEISVPATADAEVALEHLVSEFTPSSPPEAVQSSAVVTAVDEGNGKQVLQIRANLEAVEYESGESKSRRLPRSTDGLLRTTAMPHQTEALGWLMDHYEAGRPGVLVADDMGLGKTLTALAFLAWLKRLQANGKLAERPFLLVAPTGLLRNWADESTKHLVGGVLGNRLDAHGATLRAMRLAAGGTKEFDAGLPVLDVAKLQRADWVLTTYETLRDYQHSFARVAWGCLVFDEAQKLKNPTVAMTDAAKAMNADFRIAMTGTPVENRLADLWSIVDTVHPGRLGALKAFVSTYEAESPDAAAALGRLRDELVSPPPFMVRRLKEDKLPGLPEREIHLYREPMGRKQAHAYTEAVKRARTPGTKMLAFLHDCRRISLHPEDVASLSSDEALVEDSARMRVLFRCLDQVRAAGEKALVFLDSLELQGVLAGYIQRRYQLAKPPLIISGEVAGAKRKGRVDDFQSREGFDVMILSPRAAGIGLTITAANHVIHLARWWNPAVEDQCNDRVYRIGQRKKVHVHVPCAVHPTYGDESFDVKLNALLDRKREMSKDVLAPPEVSESELNAMFQSIVAPRAP